MQGDNLTLDEFIIENQKHYNSIRKTLIIKLVIITP